MKARVKTHGPNNWPYLEWSDYPSLQHIGRFVGREVSVHVDLWTGKRSQRQNRFYWGVLIPAFMQAMQQYGEIIIDKDEAHEAIRLKWLSKLVIIKGQKIRIPKSTTKLDKHEFCRLVEKVEMWCNQCGIYLPEQWVEYEK